METVKWLISKPMVRIIIYVLLSYLILEISVYMLPLKMIYYRFHLLFAVLIPSILIEKFRAGSNSFAFGLNFDKLTIYNFFSGLIIAITSVLIIFITKVFFVNHIIINENTLSVILELAFDSLIVAFIEEIFFRGIIFQALLDSIKPVPAIIFTSFLFSFVHFLNPGFSVIAFINVFTAGIVFGLMYYITKNLWMPIAFHFGWNFLTASLIDSPVSGFKYLSLISINFSFPQNSFGNYLSNNAELIFGNSFGIESGMITTIVLIISLILTLKFARLSPFQSAMIFNRNYEESKLIRN
jgi:membrane protease YdiL (CAAX protease family)